jgi:pimeloyl-ACP methyl ester carboxylesterase
LANAAQRSQSKDGTIPYLIAPDDVRLHYEVVGSGPPPILHTGGAGDGLMWRDAGYADPLSAIRTCILFDHRGHGRSDQPRSAEAHAVLRYIDDIIALLDHLELDSAAFWGYSQRADFGLSAAAIHPERFSAVITTGGMTLQETTFAEDADLAANVVADNARVAAILRERGWEGFLEGRDWTLSQWFQRQLDATNPEMLALWYVAYGLWDTWALLPQITAPVLMVVGDLEDPEHGTERGAQRIGSAQVIRLPGEDHITAFERSDLVLPLAIEFLAGLTGSPPASPEKAVAP